MGKDVLVYIVSRRQYYLKLLVKYLELIIAFVVGMQLGSAKFSTGETWWWNIDEGEKVFFIVLAIAIHIGFVYYYLSRRYLLFLKLTRRNSDFVVVIRYILLFKVYEIEVKNAMTDIQSVIRIDCREGKLMIANPGYHIYVLNRKSCKRISNYLSTNG